MLHHEPPHVLRRHSDAAPGRPYVRFANAEGPFGQKTAPTRAILREVCLFGEGGSGAARAGFSKVLEVALERPTVDRLLAASDPRPHHPRQHEPSGRAALGHARDVASPEQGTARKVVLE